MVEMTIQKIPNTLLLTDAGGQPAAVATANSADSTA